MTSGKKRYQNMKKTATILITAIMAGSISSAKDISGRVLCEGKGVAGVVVSDGTGTVITDADGKYTIDTDEDATFVFISTPAGYSSPVKDNTVDFFLPVSEKNDGYDFLLSRKKSDDRRHNLVVISDQQVYDSTEFPLLEAAAEDIAGTVRESLPVETVGICCGDIVSFDHPLYGKINRIMNRSGVTFRNIPGNHDMKNWGRSHETSTAEFEKVYGPAYYSFNVGDIHYVQSGGMLIPAGMTEFARDSTFGFASSDLKDWCAERTGGGCPADSVRSISLDELRGLDYGGVAEKLASLSEFQKCVVNCANDLDAQVFVTALAQALERKKEFLFRSAAGLVRALSGVAPRPLLTREELRGPELHTGGLVVVGSHVAKTTAQLERLFQETSGLEEICFQAQCVLRPGGAQAEKRRVLEKAERAIRPWSIQAARCCTPVRVGREICI